MAAAPLVTLLLWVALWVSWAAVAPAAPATDEPSPAEPPATSAPPTAPAPDAPPTPTEPAAPLEPRPGEPTPESIPVVVVVFLKGAPAPAGLLLRSSAGPEAPTSADGVARLSLNPGDHELSLLLPVGVIPGREAPSTLTLTRFRVEAGASVQLLVELDEQGEVQALELEGAAADAPEDEPEPTAPKELAAPGVIRGRVLSDDEQKPVEGALIVVAGAASETRTDAQGRFSLEVPSGTRSISAIHPQFSTQTLHDIEVPEGGTAEVAFALTPSASQLEDVVVTAPHIQGGVASELSKRRESVAVQDSLGSADIAKSGDGSASSASKRIVGASIVGGQFLFVRGLGGRYSNVRLNGVPLPSTDPDLPGFQLDLFPTSLLSSLTIAKTFTPDIPGDFAGGSMNIETKTFPEEFTLTLSASTSYNTETTGRTLLASPGGADDWLARDDGTRALPAEVPEQRLDTCPVRRGQEVPEGCLTQEDLAEIGRAFPNTWKLMSQTAYPNLSLGLSLGNTFDLGAPGKLGFLMTGGYKYGFERFRQSVTSVSLQGDEDNREVIPRGTVHNEVGEEEALLGGLATVGYAPLPNHSIALVALATRNAADTTSLLSGQSEEEGVDIRRTSFRFVERALDFYQVLGKHEALGDVLTVGWQLNTASIGRDQPDSRGTFYQLSPEGDFVYQSQVGGSGERLYAELAQTDYGAGLDLTVKPIAPLAVKSGYMGRISERSFVARRFLPRFGATNAELLAAIAQPPEQLFTAENSGVFWSMTESTQATDGYAANQTLHAGYGMLELDVLAWLKATGGVRLERFDHDITASSPYVNLPTAAAANDGAMMDMASTEADVEVGPLSGAHVDTDYLGAGGLIFALSDNMNVRAAYGGTVGRPQVKELAPFVTQDYVRRRTIKGNPNLQRTYVHNFDLRWELFPEPTQVFAVSAFYKAFEDPIESVLLDPNGNITFENIEGAENFGIELEARLGLAVLSQALADFSVLSNLALIQSEVTLSDEQVRSATSRSRPLAGQSPYVANLGLGWEPEALGLAIYGYYNVFGRRISDVGRQGLPDEYEEAFHSVDASVSWDPFEHFTVSASGSNLLFAKERFTQGDVTTLETSKGATFSLGAGFEY